MLACNNENFYTLVRSSVTAEAYFFTEKNATVKIIFSHFKEIEEEETIKKKLQRAKQQKS